MGRYRKPTPPGSPYITAEGEKKLQDELRQLWKIERPQVTLAVHEAAKNGDRSENGDYIYGKKRLREIDSRVRYLTKRLEQLKVIDHIPTDQTKIYFGAWVTLENPDGVEMLYRIVGPDEFNIREGLLSMDSPLAKNMLGKKIDDEFTLRINDQLNEFVITKIEYKKE